MNCSGDVTRCYCDNCEAGIHPLRDYLIANRMTEEEKQMAIALSRCTFPPGLPAKRFAREMAAKAGQTEPCTLTTKQRSWLHALVHRYRRQILPSIVKLAKPGKAV